MPINQRVNQRIIADRAGVSLATVSRVLSNGDNVTERTRQRVLKVVNDLGRGRVPKYMIGLIIPDARNPYFSDLAFAFSAEVSAMGGVAIVLSSEGQLDRELMTIQYMKNMNLDGIVFIPASDGADGIVHMSQDLLRPILLLDRDSAHSSIDFVASEYSQPIRAAVDYLVAYGHRDIACLHGPLDTQTGRARLESFRDALNVNGLAYRDDLAFEGQYDLISGRQFAEVLLGNMLETRPTAVFACNDLMAIGLMQGLQEGGWRLPEQMSVIGFDNIHWSEWTYPTLCTIGQHVPQLARVAVGQIRARIDEVREAKKSKRKLNALLDREPVRCSLPAIFIPRASVSRPWEGHGIRGVVA